ncbi:MAG: 3-deoxy-7-phosphoheptulonate synthase [Clostridia bacterium]|nr:3-deoxy-7-phosphoheptulonate synthase [Clostridia bacterium]
MSMNNMDFKRKLPIPMDVKEKYPIPLEVLEYKERRDKEIQAVFTGESDKFVLVIGPCSADREDAVMEYIYHLKDVQEKVKDKIIIIPRIYTNKPRTTGDGYKGMLHQPDPHTKPDMYKGIVEIRHLHSRALIECGFGTADEMLYPDNHRYLSDLLSYTAIGARSTENQQHRLTASGLSVPVGFKNPTSGDIGVMMNSITAAQHPHTFIYRGWEVESFGNPLAHAILRGFVDAYGKPMPNYHYEDLMLLSEAYDKRQLQNKAVIVDCNHCNSGKDFSQQPRIAMEVLNSMKASGDVKALVKGLMIESYLVDGAQKIGGDVYGQSITDACLGWEKSEKLILQIAENL